MTTNEITTPEQLQKAIEQYEDMQAELMPLLWQRDALYAEIEKAVINLQETVITDNFIYQCAVSNTTDHEAAAVANGVTQHEIDQVTTVTVKISKDKLGTSIIGLLERAGAKVTESTAWSKIKTPKPIRDKFTKPAGAKMKVVSK